MRRHDDEQRGRFVGTVFQAMNLACRRDGNAPRSKRCDRVAELDMAGPRERVIDFVILVVLMRLLDLSRLEAVNIAEELLRFVEIDFAHLLVRELDDAGGVEDMIGHEFVLQVFSKSVEFVVVDIDVIGEQYTDFLGPHLQEGLS